MSARAKVLMASSLRDRIRAQLADLKMPGALEALDDILAGVDGGKLPAPAAVEALLGAQITLRNNRRLQAAMRSSRLPAVKTLADFDFTFQPSIKREQLDSLHTLGFVERRENVVFLGPPASSTSAGTASGCAITPSCAPPSIPERGYQSPRDGNPSAEERPPKAWSPPTDYDIFTRRYYDIFSRR